MLTAFFLFFFFFFFFFLLIYPVLDWLYAKMWVSNADLILHEVHTHLLSCHLVMEPSTLPTNQSINTIYQSIIWNWLQMIVIPIYIYKYIYPSPFFSSLLYPLSAYIYIYMYIVIVATNRQLSSVHPLYKLLKPHFR